MKTATLFFAITLCLVTACNKSSDVPSLQEQTEGKWRVESFTKERYDPITNSVSRDTVICNADDYFDFLTFERLLVKYDSEPLALWGYKMVDPRTLAIKGKDWAITRLDYRQFQLSLNKRDSSFKNGDAVSFQLRRP